MARRPPATTCPSPSNAPAGSGTGLLAQYFNDAGSGIYFTALVLTRTDATVDFDWASSAPDPAVQADNFSVRWSGRSRRR